VISYYYLAGAIILEVCGTLLLPVTQNFTRPLQTLGMAVCYLGAFYCLTFAVKVIPIAIVYAIWSGVGVFLIAIFSAFVYRQMLEWPAILGLCFIIAGVGLVNYFSPTHGH
jgi:Membrane transporters of cations and cationic drugs